MNEKMSSKKALFETGPSRADEHVVVTKEMLAGELAKAQKLYNQANEKLGSRREEELTINHIIWGLEEDISYKLSDEWPEVSDENSDDRTEKGRFQAEFRAVFADALKDNQGINPVTIDRVFEVIQKYQK